MILFKECLKYNLIPVIIKDTDKPAYQQYLNQAQLQQDYQNLTNFFKEKQQEFLEETYAMIIPYEKPDYGKRAEQYFDTTATEQQDQMQYQ